MAQAGAESQAVVDPRDAAESAGLIYVSDEQRGIQRKPAGEGFSYAKPNGEPVQDEATATSSRRAWRRSVNGLAPADEPGNRR